MLLYRLLGAKKPFWLILGMLVAAGLWWGMIPVVTGYAHRAEGAEALRQVLVLLGDKNPEPDYCVGGGITQPEVRALLGQAIGDLEVARSKQRTDARTLLMLGRAYCLAGQVNAAVEAYEGYVGLKPENPLGHLELGFAYELSCFEKGQISEMLPGWAQCDHHRDAELILAEWTKAGEMYEHFLEKGVEFSNKQSYEKALLWLKRANLISPDSVFPLFKSGMIYSKLGNWDVAISYFQHVVIIEPNHRDAWYELAFVYERMEQWEEALVSYDHALAGNGTVSESRLYYQRGYLRQYKIKPFDFETVWSDYEAALQLNTFEAGREKGLTFYARGILLNQERLWENALQEFEMALPLLPRHYWLRIQTAKAYIGLSELNHARIYLLEAISIQPENKTAYMLMGDVLVSQGNHIEAVGYYKKVLEIDQDDELAKQALDSISFILSPPN